MLNNNMKQLVLNITDDCNMRCEYCTLGDKYPYTKSYTRSKMSFNTMQRGIEYLFQHAKNSHEVYISFYGGEPLLCFDLIKEGTEYAVTLSRMYKKNVKFRVTTNFTLITKDMMRFLLENNFNVTVSLNGPKEIHDKERVFKGGGGTFDIIMRNLKNFYNLSPRYFREHVTYSIVITPPFELLKVRDFFSSFPYRTYRLPIITLPNLHDTTYYKDVSNSMWIEYEKQLETLRNDFIARIKRGLKPDLFTLSFFRWNLYRIYTRSIGERDYIYPNGACIPGVTRSYLSTEGIYYPCEKVWERLPIGDVKNGINKQRVCYLYSKFINICESQCLDCWANRLCFLCYNSALEFKNGRNVLSMEKKAQYCAGVKDSLKKALILYTDIMEASSGRFFNVFKFSSTDVKDECKI